MAEGALVGVAKGITEKAGNLLAQEIVLLWNLKDEIEKLNDTVLTISAVIEDAEEKQQHNNQVGVWLKRLNDALYEADDLLDVISTEALRREVMTRNKKAKETLEIEGCSKLKSLPEGMGGLTSLHKLHIRYCRKLKSLPEGIQGLTSLNTQEITSCPILLKRYKRETGEDWPKISHIPNLNGELCQQQTN